MQHYDPVTLIERYNHHQDDKSKSFVTNGSSLSTMVRSKSWLKILIDTNSNPHRYQGTHLWGYCLLYFWKIRSVCN